MIHPLQYEFEAAHHADCQRQAAQRRLVAEAEQLAIRDTPSVPLFRALAARVRRPLSGALRVHVHQRLTRGAI